VEVEGAEGIIDVEGASKCRTGETFVGATGAQEGEGLEVRAVEVLVEVPEAEVL
jgi:hypothetical protein